ncbi:hypothetical protein BH10PSE16_BH10PSE16_15450 [soil metagenome]
MSSQRTAYEYQRFRVRFPDGPEGKPRHTTVSMPWPDYMRLLKQSKLPPRAFSKTVRSAVKALKATGYAGCLSKAVLNALKATQV